MKTPKIIIFFPSIEKGGADKNLFMISNFLSNKFKVIPQYLKEVGYNTYHIGKWHISKNPNSDVYEVCGLSVFFGLFLLL